MTVRDDGVMTAGAAREWLAAELMVVKQIVSSPTFVDRQL